MKNKVLIGINILLTVIILSLLFIYVENNNDTPIQGSYQSEHENETIQLIIDGNNYTEYTNSKLTDSGTLSNSQGNAYLLDNGEQSLLLYKDGKTIYYVNSKVGGDVLALEKILDTPTYITSE